MFSIDRALARRHRSIAAWLVAPTLLVATARAEELAMTGHGKVVSVLAAPGNPEAVSELAAKGVHVGDTGDVTITIETTTQGFTVDAGDYDFEQYNLAVTDLVISVGNWEARFDPPPGFESVNFVQVADDAKTNGVKFDGWSGTAMGVDTDGILSFNELTPQGTFLFVFSALPPKASSDDGLVQNLAKYKPTHVISFSGAGGVITLDLHMGSDGSGPTVDPAAAARKGQLKAAATLGSRVLKGLGKFAAAPPEKDPLGTAEDALLQDASESFGTQFLKAIDKALKKGGSAPLGESGEAAATKFLMGGLQAQGDSITAGADTANPLDRALRGKLLRALAANCRADFVAHSKHAQKPDADKLATALDKSRAKLNAAVGKAIEKAAAQGVVYEGPDAQGLAEALATFVDSFVELTETGVD